MSDTDQDTAREKAFVDGTLPEEDRRAPEAAPTVETTAVSEREPNNPPADRHQSPDVAAQVLANTDTGPAEPDAKPITPSLLIDKDADGLWQVTSTFKDGRVTVTHWADLRHAQHNTEPWVRENV